MIITPEQEQMAILAADINKVLAGKSVILCAQVLEYLLVNCVDTILNNLSQSGKYDDAASLINEVKKSVDGNLEMLRGKHAKKENPIDVVNSGSFESL